MANRGKNDEAWELLFEKYAILPKVAAQGQFCISADQIREFREPRLMAKFDHRINLPEIFAKNDLGILLVSRGSYVISHFRAYAPFEKSKPEIKYLRLPEFIRSIDPASLTSETVALNCALAAGIFSDFLQEPNLVPAVSGRMGSGEFSFNIRNVNTGGQVALKVQNAQIEIDAALEGADCLCLVEAKIDISDDFIIRQLYYPYRTWADRLDKKVRPVFMVCSNSIFQLYEYEFTDKHDYNSIRLVRHQCYSLEDTAITLADILAVLRGSKVVNEPALPFPQADKFWRVINLCELLYEKPMSRDDVTQEYAFDVRQANYYTDAGRYLGLLRREREGRAPLYSLTEKGAAILQLPYGQRQRAFCACILEHKVFSAVLQAAITQKAMPGKEHVVNLMKLSGLFGVGGKSTYWRRAQTISSWVAWILRLVGKQE